MRVMGIDPGLNELGYAVVEDEEGVFKVVSLGSIKQLRPGSPLALKLSRLFLKLEELLKSYRPQLLAVEEVFSRPYPSAATKLAQAQAVVHLLAGLYQIEVQSLNPVEVKSFLTGNGKANKKELFKVLCFMIKSGEVKGISEERLSNSHVSDALAISIVCLMKRGFGRCFTQ